MSKFKVGDRIVAYGCVWMVGEGFWGSPNGKVTGDITDIDENEMRIEADSGLFDVNPKQCRKLVKKKRQRYWLAIGQQSGKVFQIDESLAPDGGPPLMLPPCSNQDMPVWREFIEVRRK